ncbi:MAG: hypothetical protein Q8M65_08245, partial [Rhodoglobus sp.]|nr:hypothetical protein [Rhodoglobus sp.]
MSFFDRILFNSRERLTATDLNRHRSLGDRDLANWMMYHFADKNDATFATSDGVIGGLNASVLVGLPNPVIEIEPGMLMQYDASSGITPLVDPAGGENSPFRIARLDDADSRNIAL